MMLSGPKEAITRLDERHKKYDRNSTHPSIVKDDEHFSDRNRPHDFDHELAHSNEFNCLFYGIKDAPRESVEKSNLPFCVV